MAQTEADPSMMLSPEKLRLGIATVVAQVQTDQQALNDWTERFKGDEDMLNELLEQAVGSTLPVTGTVEKVVWLSAKADGSQQVHVRESGPLADKYVGKPLRPDDYLIAFAKDSPGENTVTLKAANDAEPLYVVSHQSLYIFTDRPAFSQARRKHRKAFPHQTTSVNLD